MNKDMMDIATSGIHDVLSISRFSTISTPAGTKNIAIYREKNVALSFSCVSLTIPEQRMISKRNIAISVPGNVNGRTDEMASPMRVRMNNPDS